MKNWFSIEKIVGQSATARPVAKVSIHDVIGYGGATVKDFHQALSSLGEVERIDVSLHSPGGAITEGWGIYNILKAHPAPVHIRVEGLAASMASVILMAADRIEMPANAYVMIHDPSWMGFGSDDLREIATEVSEEFGSMAELLDKMKGNIVAAYAARTGQDEQTLAELMRKETWMDGNDALNLGFADALIEDQKAAACAPGWAELLGDGLPTGIAFEKAEKSSGVLATLAKLLGKSGDDNKPEDTATEADALRAQIDAAATQVQAAQRERDEAIAARDRWIEASKNITIERDTALAEVTKLKADLEKFDEKVTAAVTDRLATLGVPEDRIVPPSSGGLDAEDTIESLEAELSATNDPAKRYALQTKITSIRTKAEPKT